MNPGFVARTLRAMKSSRIDSNTIPISCVNGYVFCMLCYHGVSTSKDKSVDLEPRRSILSVKMEVYWRFIPLQGFAAPNGEAQSNVKYIRILATLE